MAKRTPDQERNMRKRNWTIAAIIVTFIAIVYFVTIIKMGQFWGPGA